MRVMFFLLILVAGKVSFGQLPDTVDLALLNDTISDNRNNVRISVFRKDGQAFLFRADYKIGEMFSGADLIFEIEKLNSENKYEPYRCNKSPYPLPLVPYDVPKKELYRVEIKDDLSALECIEPGIYRIRVLFNAEWLLKSNQGDVIMAKSQWKRMMVLNSKKQLNKRNT